MSTVIVIATECCLLGNDVAGLTGDEAARAAAMTLVSCLENKPVTFGGVLGAWPGLPLLAIGLLWLVAARSRNTRATRPKRTYFRDMALAEVVRVMPWLP